LIVTNLVDGVDTYSIPPKEPLRTFRHPIHQNVPLLVSAIPGSSLFVVGSDDGCPRLYDQCTGHLSNVLRHGKGSFSLRKFFRLSFVAALVQIVDVCPLFTITLYAVLICSQAISGEDDFVIATGSSDAEDVQIKIWTPTKVIIIAVVILKLVRFHMYYQEILPVSSPCVVHQGGISFRQMLIMVLICVVVQALLIYTPMQGVAELISKVPTLIVMVPM